MTSMRISSSPIFDPKKQQQQQDSNLKLFQADVPYHQATDHHQVPDNDRYSAKLNEEKTERETCWGLFKNRDHFVSMHYS